MALMIGLSRLMLKRPDFQLTCCYLNTWHDKLSTEIFGLLRKLHRQCFLQFVHCNRQLYKDDKCPNSSQAGEGQVLCKHYCYCLIHSSINLSLSLSTCECGQESINDTWNNILIFKIFYN